MPWRPGCTQTRYAVERIGRQNKNKFDSDFPCEGSRLDQFFSRVVPVKEDVPPHQPWALFQCASRICHQAHTKHCFVEPIETMVPFVGAPIHAGDREHHAIDQRRNSFRQAGSAQANRIRTRVNSERGLNSFGILEHFGCLRMQEGLAVIVEVKFVQVGSRLHHEPGIRIPWHHLTPAAKSRGRINSLTGPINTPEVAQDRRLQDQAPWQRSVWKHQLPVDDFGDSRRQLAMHT